MNLHPFCRILAIPVVAAGVFLAAACSKSESPPANQAFKNDAILKERAARDEAFRSSSSSPIPEADRSGFRGLDYYPVNPDLRFSLRLNRFSQPRQVRMATNTGEIRSGLRYGYFEFEVDNQTCRLHVYRLDDSIASGAPNLFVPFRDATSGSETYGSGRYIDLIENNSGTYELDFNLAYNPYCAFNTRYSCPLPPQENILSVPIRAGEKKYDKGH